jgi:hypothetical protein
MQPAMHVSDVPVVPPTADEASAPRFQVQAWGLPTRLLASVALVICGANILFLAGLALTEILVGERMMPPGLLPRWIVAYSLVPLAFVGALRWLNAATVLVESGRLVLVLRRTRYEIPLASIERIRPWWLPLPGHGLALRMKSGRGFRYGLRVPAPVALLEAIGQREPLGTRAAEHLLVRFAQARDELLLRRWYHLAFKYLLFSLLPTGIVFRLHQYITYGGPFGEYQFYGLERYLKSFSGYWISGIAYLLLYAAIWRALAELLAFGATWLSPRRARGVRRFTEIALRVVYYAGIPALLAVRLLLM